ncbi:MAG TPA: DUF6265 family protein [Steroidobacteraceae bacterium]|nr:DUF6265 family protein [Steroidobacteraceae bacterium]
MRFHRPLATLAFALVASTGFAAGPPAKIIDLAWMTGTWSTAFGANTLEENWTTPANGNIASMVRMSGPTGVSMWEVITIEEKDGSLAMSIQQWDAGFKPRSPEAQKMELVEIGDKRVKFKAVTEGAMTSLGYSRGADGSFIIEAGQPGGNVAKLTLKGK